MRLQTHERFMILGATALTQIVATKIRRRSLGTGRIRPAVWRGGCGGGAEGGGAVCVCEWRGGEVVAPPPTDVLEPVPERAVLMLTGAVGLQAEEGCFYCERSH